MDQRGLASKAAIVIAHGTIGWAYCGALVGVGRQFFPMDTTLIIHAIGAPVGFAVLSWIYHKWFGFSRPIATACLFLGIVVALDVLLVAMVFEKSFAMFRSFIGTWLPFILIFASTYAVGVITNRQNPNVSSTERK